MTPDTKPGAVALPPGYRVSKSDTGIFGAMFTAYAPDGKDCGGCGGGSGKNVDRQNESRAASMCFEHYGRACAGFVPALLAERDALKANAEALATALESIRTTLDGWRDGARIGALSAEERGDDAEQVAQSNTFKNYGKLCRMAESALAAYLKGGAK